MLSHICFIDLFSLRRCLELWCASCAMSTKPQSVQSSAIDRTFATTCLHRLQVQMYAHHLVKNKSIYLSIYLSIYPSIDLSIYLSIYDTLYTIYNLCRNQNICGSGKWGKVRIFSSTRRSLHSVHAICSGCGFRRYSSFMLLPMLRFVFQQNKTLDLCMDLKRFC